MSMRLFICVTVMHLCVQCRTSMGSIPVLCDCDVRIQYVSIQIAVHCVNKQPEIVRKHCQKTSSQKKQECIPVWCLPSAAVAVYLGGGGVYPACVCLGGGVSVQGCVCLGGLSSQGGCLPREGCGVSQHPLRQTPPPPRGQNSWHTLLKILPCRNFVADGNKSHRMKEPLMMLRFWWFNHVWSNTPLILHSIVEYI